ncbi:MAG: hypothetical protein E7282_09110 [Lachnospiraceae bacterium]|nr:hypothetical protein [Lachnospiraceae bacterium]
MKQYYQACVAFQQADESLTEQINQVPFDEMIAIQSVEILYALYQEMDESASEKVEFRADRIAQLMRENTDNGFYSQWQIWYHYFISMGAAEWQQFWIDLSEYIKSNPAGNSQARFLAEIPQPIYNVGFAICYIAWGICYLYDIDDIASAWTLIKMLLGTLIWGSLCGIVTVIIAGLLWKIMRNKRG